MSKILDKVISIKSLDELSAIELSDFIHLLIRSELKPGGPYKFNNSVINHKKINNHIYHLFLAKGKKLNPEMKSNKGYKQTEKQISLSDSYIKNIDSLHEKIKEEFKYKFETNDCELIDSVAKKIKKADCSGEISQLSTIFYESLKKDYRDKFDFTEKIREHYSFANIYTWLTYTIIDNLLDTNFSVEALPSVLILQRDITYHYLEAGVDMRLIQSIFNTVDKANNLELKLRQHLSFKQDGKTISFSKISPNKTNSLMWKKSIAHTLGPISILGKINTKYLNDLESAMKLYCSARQLNDDVHDWQEDFSNGQMTYVIDELLTKVNLPPGEYNYTKILDLLKTSFWEEVLPILSKRIQADIQKAINLLEGHILEKDSKFVEYYLLPIYTSAEQAINRNNFEKKFLKNAGT